VDVFIGLLSEKISIHWRTYKHDAVDIMEMSMRIDYRKKRMHRILEEEIIEGSGNFMKLGYEKRLQFEN